MKIRLCGSVLSGLLCLIPAAFLPSAWAAPPVVRLLVKSVTVGDVKNPDALPQAVQDAYKAGARRIVIRPGVYFLPKTGGSVFRLDGWKDAVVSAYGATLILTDLSWNHNLFDLHACTHVTVQGGTLSQNAVTAYQGRVIAVGADPDGKATCDFRPDAGYPVPPPAAPKGFLGGDVNIVDGATRRLKVGCGDYYGVPGEAVGGGLFRVHFREKTLPFGAGDRLVGRYGDAPFKVFLDGCRGCTIKDVTLMRNGFAPVREDGGGGNRLLHCVWALGPRPAGATEAPLVTNAADGLHSTGADPGPDIEGCVFAGVFLDDCIAIHGGFQAVQSAEGRTLIVKEGYGGLAAGGPVRLSNDKGFFAEATVAALKDNGDKKENGDKTATVTLDRDLNVPPGVKVSSPRHNGAGYKILGCRLGGTRSRGILIKADGGRIENNVIDGCGQAAISVGPEYYWNEADYVHGLTIAGNVLHGNGLALYGGGAILIHGDGAVGNQNITLQNNRCLGNYQGDIDAAWTDGLTLVGNVFTGVAPRPAAPPAAVSLAHCRRVRLAGNAVHGAAAYRPALVQVGAEVSDMTGNDPGGIRADSSPSYGHDGSPTDTHLRFVGRWDRRDPKAAHSHWGGAYLRVAFTGTSAVLDGGAVSGGPNMLVSLDGEPPREVPAFHVQGLPSGLHTLLLGSPGQNSEIVFRGLTLDAGAKTLPVPARPLIEFVGDSITTGGGQTLPSTVNYAWESAEALGADHVQIAFSARALTTGYGCADDKTGLDTQYFQTTNFNHLADTPPLPWDFSYTPRVIVINLGQNDQCGGEPDAVLTASYVRFAGRLRARFPAARIVALRPFGGPYAAAIRRAVDTLNAGGDAGVVYVDTTGWLDKPDFVDGVHPSESGHRKAAARLTAALRPLLVK